MLEKKKKHSCKTQLIVNLLVKQFVLIGPWRDITPA